MSYQVTFTEINNPLKPPITVEDQTINTQTSVTFIGKNYAGYGPLIAKNFLHLLENSASPTAPARQVQGQLWFDNTPEVSQLKVNIDGTPNGWVSAGGIKKSPSTPSISSSIQGDLWVDTVNQQLSLFTGSNWLLIGPTFSAGSQTGPKLEQIVDTLNVTHTVQSIYVENQRVMIISTQAFTPKATQVGFETINKGVNLSSSTVTSSDAYKYNGIATQADSLTDTAGKVITAANLLRSDQASITDYTLNVRNAGGITVGTDTGSVTIYTEANTNAATFYAKSGNSIDFKVNTDGSPSTVLHLDPSSFVGIRKNNPTVALDVNGDVSANGILSITSTSTSSINTLGGLTVAGLTDLASVNVSGLITTGGNIVPSTTDTYDLGSNPNTGGKAFANIYATDFWGNFNGTFSGGFTGSVSGSATKLASPTKFSIIGDIVNASTDSTDFDGQNQTVTFNTTLTSAAVSGQTQLANTLGTDEILVYRPSESGLKKVTVETLVLGLPTVPVGAIFPFAGMTTKIPKGYLLCDGAEVYSSVYSALFEIIGYSYKDEQDLVGTPGTTFALPDFRGRTALGRDSMDNRIKVGVSGIDEYTVTSPALRVDSEFARTLGKGAGASTVELDITNLPEHKHDMRGTDNQGRKGNSYFAVRNVAGVPDDVDAIQGPGGQAANQAQYLGTSGRVLSDTVGVPVDIMNPYLTINYIIFTGVTA